MQLGVGVGVTVSVGVDEGVAVSVGVPVGVSVGGAGVTDGVCVLIGTVGTIVVLAGDAVSGASEVLWAIAPTRISPRNRPAPSSTKRIPATQVLVPFVTLILSTSIMPMPARTRNPPSKRKITAMKPKVGSLGISGIDHSPQNIDCPPGVLIASLIRSLSTQESLCPGESISFCKQTALHPWADRLSNE